MGAAVVPPAVLDVVLFASPGYGPAWPNPAPPTPVVLSVLPDNGVHGVSTLLTFFGSGFVPTSKIQAQVGGGAWVDQPTTYTGPTGATTAYTAAAAGQVNFRVSNGVGFVSAITGWTAT